MVLAEKIRQYIQRLPAALQQEALDFVEYLLTKAERKAVLREEQTEAYLAVHERQAAENAAEIQVSEEGIRQDLPTYLQRVEAGETVVILKAGKPVAEIKPIAPAAGTLRPFGLGTGEFTVPDDFDAPLPEHLIQEFEKP